MENQGKVRIALDKAIRGLGFLGGCLILLNGFFIAYDVAMRYLFNSPTVWVFEVSIYLVIAATCLSFAYALLEKAHVRVDFISVHLKGRTAIILEILTSLLAILYCVVVGWEGCKMVSNSYHIKQVSPTLLKVPLFIPHSLIPLGFAILIFQFIRYLKDLIKSLPLQDSAWGRGTVANVLNQNILQFLVPGIFIVLVVLSLMLLKVNMVLGLLILFFVLLFSGMPVAFALGLFGLCGLHFLFGGDRMMRQTAILAYSTLDSFTMVALPLFVLTSCVLKNAGVGVRIYRFADVLVRHLPGGLGIASIIFCCLFAAMTGSSTAVVATVTMIALPEMLARGYSRRLTIGLLAAGGTLGILFPPSLPLLLYASMTNESIGALFMGTLLPGVILAVMFSLYMVLAARRDKNIQRQPRATFKEITSATKEAIGGLFTIIIIMGGIYSGIFTPTESGGVAAVYSVILGLFIYRSLSMKGLKTSLLEITRINAFIMMIIIGANLTQQVILMGQIPQNIVKTIATMQIPPWVVMLSINIFLILMGGPLEAITILVITLPMLYPLVTQLGFSGVWFALIMMINMELAMISPPEGINLFVLQDMAKSNAAEVSWGVVPFLIIIGLFLVLISFVPSLVTWLPSLMKL